MGRGRAAQTRHVAIQRPARQRRSSPQFAGMSPTLTGSSPRRAGARGRKVLPTAASPSGTPLRSGQARSPTSSASASASLCATGASTPRRWRAPRPGRDRDGHGARTHPERRVDADVLAQLAGGVRRDGAAAEADEGVRRGRDRPLDGCRAHHRLGDHGVVDAEERAGEITPTTSTARSSVQIAIAARSRANSVSAISIVGTDPIARWSSGATQTEVMASRSPSRRTPGRPGGRSCSAGTA